MQKKLIIVESPAKAKTIKNYLGKGFEVIASVGHIIDLPSKTLGVDIEDRFTPTYEIIPGKEKVVSKLVTAANSADTIYLAPDPDREGEAIAWHIYEQIKSKNKPIHRVLFNEITKQGVKDALNNPTQISMNRVNAQQSRRILDRLVGYQVSPLLWKPLKYGLSAGRVQSVALRMICEREDEIEKFVTDESWSIEGLFKIEDKKNKISGDLSAMLDKESNEKIDLKTETDADKVIAEIDGKPFIISSVEKKDVRSKAPVPFVTARIQQEAIRKFRMTAKRVMSIAQQLYEGIDIGEGGPEGLITYMRTDSIRVSPEASNAAASYITATYGKEYLTKRRGTKSQGANVQDAHEAIRPTDASRTPDSIKNHLTTDQFKLYDLIWKRFIASQMSDAVYEQTTVLIDCDKYQFRTSGRVMKFAGYTILYTEEADEDEKEEITQALLGVNENDEITLNEFNKKQHFTVPPPRFTEASIVRMLEQKGIGRPSTYAAIISTVVEREYVQIDKRRMFPTELGRVVSKLLVQNFPQIFDMKFTAIMEKGLDKVESGEQQWLDLLDNFYSSFSKELDKAKKQFDTDLIIGMSCPECSKPLSQKYGKMGAFIACTAYPECSFTSDFARSEDGKMTLVERKGAEGTGIICDKCGKEMMLKQSRYGEMLACSGYPECKNIKNHLKLPDGSIRIIEPGEKLGKKCTECDDGEVVLKSGRNGLFAACSKYPKCRYTASVKVDDNGEITITENNTPETMGSCENCGKPMVIKKSFRGPFLACSGYPKCKTTKSMKTAIREAAEEKAGVKVDNKQDKEAKKVIAKKTATKKTTALKKSSTAKSTTKKATAKKDTAKKDTDKKDTDKKATAPKKSSTAKSTTKKTTTAKAKAAKSTKKSDK